MPTREKGAGTGNAGMSADSKKKMTQQKKERDIFSERGGNRPYMPRKKVPSTGR